MAEKKPYLPIYQRPIRRKQPTKMSDIDFYVGVEEFGKNSTKVGIGFSRKEKRPPPPIPGPGQYDPPPRPISATLPHRISTSHQTLRDPMTTNIDYIDHRVFPEEHRFCIGKRQKLILDYPVESPSPSFFSSSSFAKPKISVAPRIRERPPDGIPGPGTYDPLEVNLPRNPAFSLTGPKYRDDWIVDHQNTPPPGEYNPARPATTTPGWTLGNRSRSSKNKKAPEKFVPFAIDQFVVKLDSSISTEEARTYVDTHPEFCYVIREIFETVSRNKPENPQQYLMEYFEGQKGFPPPPTPKRPKSSIRKLYLTSIKPRKPPEPSPFDY